jgi:hypothetical protein
VAKLLALLAWLFKLKAFDGYRTYAAGVGLIGLGVYQLTQGDVDRGLASVMAGLAAFGVRAALAGHATQLAGRLDDLAARVEAARPTAADDAADYL